MSNQRIGFAGTTLVEKIDSPKILKTQAGVEVTELFNVNYSSAESAITTRGYTYGDACPAGSGAYATSLLLSIGIEKDGPINAQVTYKWAIPDPTTQEALTPVGTVVLGADSNAIEVPIGQHPNKSGTNYDEDKKIGIGSWEGIEAFLSPQPVFSRTETLSSFAFSQINVVGAVGKLMSRAEMTANGLAGATDKYWMQMALSVTQNGSIFTKKEDFQFADNGWAADLYEGTS